MWRFEGLGGWCYSIKPPFHVTPKASTQIDNTRRD